MHAEGTQYNEVGLSFTMAITFTLEMLIAVRQTPGTTKLTPPFPPVANSLQCRNSHCLKRVL